jgi:hypothetical protein
MRHPLGFLFSAPSTWPSKSEAKRAIGRNRVQVLTNPTLLPGKFVPRRAHSSVSDNRLRRGLRFQARQSRLLAAGRATFRPSLALLLWPSLGLGAAAMKPALSAAEVDPSRSAAQCLWWPACSGAQ